jgi:hypothetical protein
LTPSNSASKLEADITALPSRAVVPAIPAPTMAKFLPRDDMELCRLAKAALACFSPLGSKLVRIGILIAIFIP